MGWQHYRGKQAKTPTGYSFLDNIMKGEKQSYVLKCLMGWHLCYLERVVTDHWINYKCLDNWMGRVLFYLRTDFF